MKFNKGEFKGAREGYDPKKYDDRRKGEGSLAPWDFRDNEPRTDVDSKERRKANFARKHKRRLKKNNKHGRKGVTN